MDLVKTLVSVLTGLIALYLVVSWLFQSDTKLTSREQANKKQVIDIKKLPDNNTSNYTKEPCSIYKY